MIQRLEKSQHAEEGFTLVELLVVIVILGILAAIVVFAVGGISDKGSNSAKATDVSVLQAAEEAEFAKSVVIPPVYQSMTLLQSGGFLRTGSTLNVICMSTAASTPATGANLDYFIAPQTSPAYANGATCPPSPAPVKTGYIVAN
jgi:general secretion pathway protein G